MADEFVQVEMSMPTSDYALVIFNNTPETYPTDGAIECSYTVTPMLEPSKHDWVGIYKVGWRSPREYHCFDWSKIPADYKKGDKFDVNITFPASSLPQDDGEFYQFCYVTGNGHVRGASTPFQFRKPGSEEYVEVEDEDDDNILIIKTKTAMLEDKLSKVDQEKEELSKTVEYLEKEKETLLAKLMESERNVTELEKEKETTDKIQQAVAESLEDQKNENTELILLQNSLKEKIATLKQEKESCAKRLDDNDEYINSLQQKIKTLVNEKDALIGRNRTLEEEKELFNKHFSSSEDRIKGYMNEIEDLKLKLRKQEEMSAELRSQIKTLQDQLTEAESKLEKQIQIAVENKVTIDDLTEKLHNCEDKLAAAEKCKELLNEEVKSLKQTLDKLSEDLEKSMSESHNYKTVVAKQKDRIHRYTEKINSLEKALNAKEEELQANITEYRKLKEMHWEQETKEKAKEDGAQYALNMAYETLKSRYEKMRQQKDEAQKHAEEMNIKLKQCEAEKDKVIADMKERLRLGQDQYKERVIECQHLQKELKRIRYAEKVNREVVTHTGTAEEKPQVKSGESQTDVVYPADDTQVMDDQNLEAISQLSDLGKELEARRLKKQRYKQLYQEEKEKRVYIEKQCFSEIQKKDEEIESLKKKLEEAEHISVIKQLELQDTIDALKAENNQLKAVQHQSTVPTSSIPAPPPFAQYGPRIPINQPTHINVYPARMPAYTGSTMYYPPQQIRPPNLYPILYQCPPIPPRTCETVTSQPTPLPNSVLPPQAVDTNISEDASNDTTTLNDLDAPVPPLPRPLSPQRSPEAITAALRAISEGTQDLNLNEEEERYRDAEAEMSAAAPQEATSPPTLITCPVCNMVFSNAVDQCKIEEHVESHLEKVCPMCGETFDKGVKMEVFQHHVDCHFTE